MSHKRHMLVSVRVYFIIRPANGTNHRSRLSSQTALIWNKIDWFPSIVKNNWKVQCATIWSVCCAPQLNIFSGLGWCSCNDCSIPLRLRVIVYGEKLDICIAAFMYSAISFDFIYLLALSTALSRYFALSCGCISFSSFSLLFPFDSSSVSLSCSEPLLLS